MVKSNIWAEIVSLAIRRPNLSYLLCANERLSMRKSTPIIYPVCINLESFSFLRPFLTFVRPSLSGSSSLSSGAWARTFAASQLIVGNLTPTRLPQPPLQPAQSAGWKQRARTVRPIARRILIRYSLSFYSVELFHSALRIQALPGQNKEFESRAFFS